VEPHLAVNPNNPHHLVAASIVGGFTGVAVFVSFDGGDTWTPVRSAGLHDLAGFGDPWLAFGRNDDVFLVGLDDSSNALVWRSMDGGLTWSEPSPVPGPPFDHTSIVVDRTSTESSGIVYVLAAQSTRDKDGSILNVVALARSTNYGESFEETLQVLPTNLKYQAGVPVVLPDGTVVFSFMDFSTERTSSRLLRTRRLWVVRTSDHGRTFSRPAFVAEVTDFKSFPTLAADTSATSPHIGRLYSAHVNLDGLSAEASATAREFEQAYLLRTPIGVIISYSENIGATWSTPRLVAGGMAEAWRTAIAVNPQGVVAVAWQQRTRKVDTCFEPYFTASLDGGRTFLEPVRLADTDVCPESDVPGNIFNGFDVANRWPTGGDYFGIASDSTGVFHILWSDSRTGVFQLWAARAAIQ